MAAVVSVEQNTKGTRVPRISFPDEEALTPEQQRVFDNIVAGPRGMLVGPLRAALHRPDLADAWQRFGAMLRYDTSLPPKLSELAILVTARRWNSQLEWFVHSAAALKMGLPQSVVDKLLVGESPEFEDAEEEAVYEFSRELQISGEVSDEVYARIYGRWGAVGVVELSTLIGYYTLVSMTLNAHHIPLPKGVTPPLAPCDAKAAPELTHIAASVMRPAMGSQA